MLHVTIGDGLLDLDVGSESSSATNDGAASAVERIVPLTASSSAVPGLATVSTPAVEVASTGPEQATTAPGVDLGGLVAGPVPGVLDGSIDPTSLRAVADAAGSIAGATGGVSDLAVLGGLLEISNIDVELGSNALPGAAGAARSLTVDRIEVLDLSAVLQLLGIDLADLPLDIATELLVRLGVPLPNGLPNVDAVLQAVQAALDAAGDVPEQLSALQAQVDAAQDEFDGLLDELDGLEADLDAAEAQRDAAQADVAVVEDALADAEAELAAAQSELATLTPHENCSLLSVIPIPGLGLTCQQVLNAIASLQSEITALTTDVGELNGDVAALDSVVSGLTAEINSLLGDIADVNALIDQVQAEIDGLLALIDQLLATIGTLLDPVADIVGGIVSLLDDAPLVVIEDLTVAALAAATSTLDASQAVVDGSVGSVRVGELPLTGVDALALADQADAVVRQVLSALSPALANFVDIDLLTRSTNTSVVDGRNVAEAAITGLRLRVTPPDLCALLAGLEVEGTLGGLLGMAGVELPTLDLPLEDILEQIDSVLTCGPTAAGLTSGPTAAQLVSGLVPALTAPLTIEALDVTGRGAFAATPTQVTTTTSSTTSTTAGPTTTTGSPSTTIRPGTGAPTRTPTNGQPLPRTGAEVPVALLGLGVSGSLLLRRLLTRAS